MALAKAEMEAVIQAKEDESENFVENENLPEKIDKDYVLQLSENTGVICDKRKQFDC